MRDLSGANRILKDREGLKLKAYQDTGGVWTIGEGTTVYPNGKKVKRGDTITIEQAEQYKLDHINTITIPAIDRLVKVELNNNQFNALVSFVYNIGGGQFSTSTILKKINKSDFVGAAEEFKRWKYDNGKVYQGLIIRRKMEKALFITPVDEPTKDIGNVDWIAAFIEAITHFIKSFFGRSEKLSIKEEILSRNKILNPKALEQALIWLKDQRVTNKDYLIVCDMSQYDYEKRFHLIDMNTYKSMSTWCSHGSKSDHDKDGKADSFSNVSGSNKSSLGAMVINEEYKSRKRKTGARSSFQISRRIDGLESGKNSNVRKRAIVLHDGFYVTPERARAKNVGDSLGCFVLYYPVLKEINDKLQGVLLYNHI